MNFAYHLNISKRVRSFIHLMIPLAAAFFYLKDLSWQGTNASHTLFELMATLFAFFTGVLALVRYYTKKTNTLLCLAVGFLGTGILETFHTLATSPFMNQLFPSPPPALIPWTWSASRIFLSLFLFLSWLAWKREAKLGGKGLLNEKTLLSVVALVTLATVFLFSFYPLPRAYYPEYVFGRPMEFIASYFFLLALIGYLVKGEWKKEAMDYWIVLSLLLSTLTQTCFISFSHKLFDSMFYASLILKQLSYICVAVGLLTSKYQFFKSVEGYRREAEEQLAKSQECLKQMEEALREALKAREAAETGMREALGNNTFLEQKSAELEKMNQIMVGRELKMIALKKEINELKKQLGEPCVQEVV